MSESYKQGKMLHTLSYMFRIMLHEKPYCIAIYILTGLAAIGSTAAGIIFPKYIVDELVAMSNEGVATHIAAAVHYTVLLALAVITARLISAAGNFVLEILREWFTEHIGLCLAKRTMDIDFQYTEDPNVLDKLNKAQEGMGWYSGGVMGVTDTVYSIGVNIGTAVTSAAIIIFTCPILLPVQVISLVFISWLQAKVNKIGQASFAKLSKSNRIFGYVFWHLVDFRTGKDIRLYDSVEMINRKLEFYSKKMNTILKDQAHSERSCFYGMEITNSIRDGLSCFYIGWLALSGIITIGDVSMCISAAGTLYSSLQGIVESLQDIANKCNYAHHYIEFMEYPAALSKGSRKVTGDSHFIEFHNVSFKYPRSKKWALRNVNISIKQGEHLSVVGLNGAGKTTFIKLLCRLYDVTEGEILIDGVNIKEYSDEEYKKLFTVVFQDFSLFAFSLRENIVFSSDTATDSVINEVIEKSGLSEDVGNLINGLDTMIFKSFDENGTELSGGQKQKVAIARSLYKDSPIVILDEPTAALDPIAEYDIYRQFDTLVGGKTAVYISHRLSSCKFCDHIAVFVDGTIKEYGTHDDLMAADGGIYAKMFAAQAHYYVGWDQMYSDDSST